MHGRSAVSSVSSVSPPPFSFGGFEGWKSNNTTAFYQVDAVVYGKSNSLQRFITAFIGLRNQYPQSLTASHLCSVFRQYTWMEEETDEAEVSLRLQTVKSHLVCWWFIKTRINLLPMPNWFSFLAVYQIIRSASKRTVLTCNFYMIRRKLIWIPVLWSLICMMLRKSTTQREYCSSWRIKFPPLLSIKAMDGRYFVSLPSYKSSLFRFKVVSSLYFYRGRRPEYFNAAHLSLYLNQALHWAAKNGNTVMLTKLIECGASAPYHRMVELKQAKQRNKSPNDASYLALASHEGKRLSYDLAHNVVYRTDSTGPDNSIGSIDDNSSTNKSNKIKNTSLCQKEMNNDDNDSEILLETSTDLTVNTPLQWSVVKGHLRAVWLLLLEGYSANDVDHLGNNSVHLAAVNGQFQILKVLLEDGGRADIVNIYKNLPIDMATGMLSIHSIQLLLLLRLYLWRTECCFFPFFDAIITTKETMAIFLTTKTVMMMMIMMMMMIILVMIIIIVIIIDNR